MAVETRPWFPMGDWKEAQGSFGDDGNVLYLNQGDCYTDGYIFQNSLYCTLKITHFTICKCYLTNE